MARNKIKLDVQRTDLANGASFGDTGPYERLLGKVAFAIDPDEPGLPFIVDLDLAPRNADGMVEFEADLDVLKPVDLGKGNRRLLFDVANRGNRVILPRMNDGAGNDPANAGFAGNGFLMREGYTIVWGGWQGDIMSMGGNIVAYLPEARENGQPVRGRVRQEFIVDAEGVLSQIVSGTPNIEPYPVLDRSNATLTMREHEQDARQPVPDSEWDLARAERKNGSVELTPSKTDLYIKGGFKPGWVYELIYDTEGSRVNGLGLLGVRDLVSFLRFDSADSAGTANPLAASVDKAYMYGVSLSGRVVREYVYEGFNQDPQERKVFDAVQTHVGIGRVYINQRFAQIGRFPRQHEEHTWAAERYPFTFTAVPDPFTEKVDAVLKRPGTDPLVMHTHTSSEYWQRHGSTGHTDPRDGDDLDPPDEARMYFVTGAPHGVGVAGAPWLGQGEVNSMQPTPILRACLVLMDRWATEGIPPPASLLPRRTDGTLVTPEEVLAHFPRVPGVKLPAGPSRLPFYNYGPDFDDRGMVTVMPPEAKPGQEYIIQVPQIDADGNERAGLHSPDLAAPLGTYTGWALRKPGYAEPDNLSLNGTFIPFARTKAEREAKGDPRLSIEERYANHDGYVKAVTAAVEDLRRIALLLDEDADRYLEAARRKNPFDPSVRLGPLLD
jgi:alpha/beta hydrolase family protein